ncbi:hypothetical protein EV363DRAFT_1401008 [Boletus edulis]|nr:hypothetical protein EV363DRAFT_1401008 [Boletus edulis]
MSLDDQTHKRSESWTNIWNRQKQTEESLDLETSHGMHPPLQNLQYTRTGTRTTPSGVGEPIYGDTAQDAGDEVRFSIELTQIDRLKDTYSLDIRRLKGNLRSYKFLYDTIRENLLSLAVTPCRLASSGGMVTLSTTVLIGCYPPV